MPQGLADARRMESEFGDRLLHCLPARSKLEQAYLLNAGMSPDSVSMSPISLDRYTEISAVKTGDDRPTFKETSRLGQAACMLGSIHNGGTSGRPGRCKI